MTLAELSALHKRAFPGGGVLRTADFGRVADFYKAAHDYMPVLIAIIEEMREYGADEISFANCCNSADIPPDPAPFNEIITTHLEKL